MRPTTILLACAACACTCVDSVAAPAAAVVQARNAPSCGEWVAQRKKADSLALANGAWLIGYLSGLTVASGRDSLEGSDNATLFAWMDAYCRSHPLKDAAAGGRALLEEAQAKRPAAK